MRAEGETREAREAADSVVIPWGSTAEDLVSLCIKRELQLPRGAHRGRGGSRNHTRAPCTRGSGYFDLSITFLPAGRRAIPYWSFLLSICLFYNGPHGGFLSC